MNDNLIWKFDSIVIDWLVVLEILFVLSIIGAIATRLSFRVYKRFKQQVNNLPLQTKHWHHQPINSVLEFFQTGTQGLSLQQSTEKLKKHGANRLPEVQVRSSWVRFFYQFHNVLIYVLMIASAITATLGQWLDACVILGVVILNAIIGFIQEGKAEDALKAIRQMLSPNAMVLRDQQQIIIPAEQLVPGDVVILQSGDKVPADLRLFRVKGLQIQESVLTGESMAVEKTTAPVAEESVVGDRLCMAYSGTLVTHGQGNGIVVATGSNTEIGRISRLVSETESLTTPLLRQMAQFGHWLTVAILLISAITFSFGVWIRDYIATEMFLAAVSIAVAAIPEGLPAIMTITLAIGVQRMAARNAIIRRLPAVETLGSVSVICTDKTGTLTRNEMTVRTIATDNELYSLSGTGYDPHGSFLLADNIINPEDNPLLLDILRAGMLCNDTSLENKDNQWLIHGDPMEGALLISGLKAGMEVAAENMRYPRTDLIPFESEHRFMATLHHSHNGEAFIYLKGAPEQILEICHKQRTTQGDQALDKQYWSKRIEEMAQQGQRVLAIALKPVDYQQIELSFSDVENHLILLGLFGMIDPPRDEAISAISSCKQAGIRVKMITGDHAATARAIAQQLQLNNAEKVYTGQDLDLMTEDELRQKVKEVDIYARVNPEHKLLLVKLLQEHELIVAMTGDGVNDAPALKRADVGTAMGFNGTEAAKEAAEMVLIDDNFASIAHAVEEGRTVYDNIKKSILFILPTNGGEALIILSAILLGFHQLPLTPVQILWVNMVTAVTLALSLGFEPPESNVMLLAPRHAKEPLLTNFLIWRIIMVSFIMMLGTMGLYLWEMQKGETIEHARTVAVNTLVMFEILYLFNSRYLLASVLNWKGLTGNPYVLIAITVLIIFQLGFTYLTPFQSLFGSTGIEIHDWLNITLVASSVFLFVEFEKFLIRLRKP